MRAGSKPFPRSGTPAAEGSAGGPFDVPVATRGRTTVRTPSPSATQPLDVATTSASVAPSAAATSATIAVAPLRIPLTVATRRCFDASAPAAAFSRENGVGVLRRRGRRRSGPERYPDERPPRSRLQRHLPV